MLRFLGICSDGASCLLRPRPRGGSSSCVLSSVSAPGIETFALVASCVRILGQVSGRGSNGGSGSGNGNGSKNSSGRVGQAAAGGVLVIRGETRTGQMGRVSAGGRAGG